MLFCLLQASCRVFHLEESLSVASACNSVFANKPCLIPHQFGDREYTRVPLISTRPVDHVCLECTIWSPCWQLEYALFCDRGSLPFIIHRHQMATIGYELRSTHAKPSGTLPNVLMHSHKRIYMHKHTNNKNVEDALAASRHLALRPFPSGLYNEAATKTNGGLERIVPVFLHVLEYLQIMCA